MAKKKEENNIILDSSILDAVALDEYAKENIEEKPKKKRGRPKRDKGYNDVSPYKDFQPYIYTIFGDFLNTYYLYIDRFMNFKDRIDKDFWISLQKHIATICNQLKDYEDSNGDFKEYTYRTKSQWRGIDEVRENLRKKFVTDFYNNKNIDDVYKAYMIFLHLKLYIIESSREMIV